MNLGHETVLALGLPGGWEWMVVLVVAVLIFGRRLPDIARSIGKSITEFKKGVHDIETDVRKSIDESEKTETASKTETDNDDKS